MRACSNASTGGSSKSALTLESWPSLFLRQKSGGACEPRNSCIRAARRGELVRGLGRRGPTTAASATLQEPQDIPEGHQPARADCEHEVLRPVARHPLHL